MAAAAGNHNVRRSNKLFNVENFVEHFSVTLSEWPLTGGSAHIEGARVARVAPLKGSLTAEAAGYLSEPGKGILKLGWKS